MAKSPMAEASVEILEEAKRELSFQELFDKVIVKLGLDEATATKRIAKMYSDLTLDKRFISLPENKWDLRKRHKLDDVLVSTEDIIIEDEEEFDDEEEIEIVIDYDSIREKPDYEDDIMEISKLASLDDEHEGRMIK